MVIVYTDRRLAELSTVVLAAVAGGATYVVLREKDLPPDDRAALAASLRRAVGDRLLVSGVDGRHRDAAGRVVGHACHDRRDLETAAADGAVYATLSPVFPPTSKPGDDPPVLGLAGLQALSAGLAVRVCALGGIDTPERAVACVRAGAAGVAVLGAVMRAPDPSTVVRQLKEAVCAHSRR
jgi:thiamine-phosphate pyrophosphorylase